MDFRGSHQSAEVHDLLLSKLLHWRKLEFPMPQGIPKIPATLIPLFSLLYFPVAVLGIYLGGIGTFLGFVAILGSYFFLQWLDRIQAFDHERGFFASVRHQRIWTTLVCVFHFASLFLVLFYLKKRVYFSDAEAYGIIFSLGLACGTVGGCVAHEDIHSVNLGERILGYLMFASLGYGHFPLTHRQGHHRVAGQPEDWNTARIGESLYHFVFRSAFEGYLEGWKLARKRQKRLHTAFFSICNEMLMQLLGFLAFNCLIWLIFGFYPTRVFWGICLGALFVFEGLNYCTHYGMVRTSQDKESYSWDSVNFVYNGLFLQAGHHQHHHLEPALPGAKLRKKSSFVLNCGLIELGILAVVPWMYFRFMSLRISAQGK